MKTILFLAIVVLIHSQILHADMLVLSDQSKPVFGMFDSNETGTSDEIRFFVFDAAQNRFELRRFNRSKVQLAVPTVNQEQLVQLSVLRLREMYDFAEELASHRKDPVAQMIARRLVLVCIHCGSEAAGNEKVVALAARTLVGLARSDAEREQFERIAFVYSGARPQRRDSDSTKSQKETGDNEAVKKTVLQIVQALRREDYSLANRLVESEPGKRVEQNGEWTDFHAEVKKTIQQQELVLDLKRKLIAMELELRFGTIVKDRGGAVSNSAMTKKRGSFGLHEIADFDLTCVETARGWLKLDGLEWLAQRRQGAKE